MEQFYSGNMPVLALRGMVLYPDQTMHFDIGRMKSLLALEAAKTLTPVPVPNA